MSLDQLEIRNFKTPYIPKSTGLILGFKYFALAFEEITKVVEFLTVKYTDSLGIRSVRIQEIEVGI